MFRRRINGLILAALVVGCCSPVARALSPEEIAVLFNTKSPASLRIARYYLNARKIPEDHLIPVVVDLTDEIPEETYRNSIVPQIKKALDERKLTASIKCLVTTYDIPLRIGPRIPTADEHVQIEDYQKREDAILEQLAKAAADFDAIAPATPLPAPPASSPATTQDKPTLAAVLRTLSAAATASVHRVQALSEPTRSQNLLPWMQIQQRVAGIQGILSTLQPGPEDPILGETPAQQRFNALSQQMRKMQDQYRDLAKEPDSRAVREDMLTLQGQGSGLVGQGQLLEQFIARYAPVNSGSCLDNELALLPADQNYSRANWLNNPKNVEIFPTLAHATNVTPTLMVARLDGSSADKVIEMIDTSLKVEAKGLDGKIYLDARGLHTNDGYGAFDADLRKAYDWLKAHATMAVILDDRPELLEAKDCPDAALYCGWYSLMNYKDSCQWLPGAVGYHVASFEMTTLHQPNNHEWVVNLLDRGFCGTLGATDEPYLNAFPKPSLFFPLLLSGDFTQGEVWQVTAPTLSWRIAYVGDPLYNPFKAKPRVKPSDLKENPILRNAYTILGDAKPSTPATLPLHSSDGTR